MRSKPSLKGGADPEPRRRVDRPDLRSDPSTRAAEPVGRRKYWKAFTNDGEWASVVRRRSRRRCARLSAGLRERHRRGRRGRRGGGRQPLPARGAPNITSKGGLTPLLHAARQGHLDVDEALCSTEARISIRLGVGDGTSPLLIATINGQFDAAPAPTRAWGRSERRLLSQRRYAALGDGQLRMAATHSLPAAATARATGSTATWRRWRRFWRPGADANHQHHRCTRGTWSTRGVATETAD